MFATQFERYTMSQLFCDIWHFLYSSAAASSKNKNKNKTTKMMAILMGTYYGFFLPQIINTYIEYDPIAKIYSSHLLYVIFFLNAVINPIVYGWMSPDFNLAFRTILHIKIDDKKFSRTANGSVYIRQQSAKSKSILNASGRVATVCNG